MALNMQTGKLAAVASLDHVNILTPDVDTCRKFYVDALGFEEGFRPNFGFPGLWLYLGNAPVLHFIETDAEQGSASGNIDHIAFRAHNFDEFTARLKANGIEYEDREIPGMDLHQLMCIDPHGIKVEFNFEGQDRPWKTLQKVRREMKSAAGARSKRAVKKSTRKKTKKRVAKTA